MCARSCAPQNVWDSCTRKHGVPTSQAAPAVGVPGGLHGRLGERWGTGTLGPTVSGGPPYARMTWSVPSTNPVYVKRTALNRPDAVKQMRDV